MERLHMSNRKSSVPLHIHLLLWVLAFVAPTSAQTSHLFQWGFANNFLSSSLPTCSPLSIIVKPFNVSTNSTHGTPPFSMIALVVGGTPVTTLIGTDENNLSWTVTESPGSRLVLNVVDANGSSGGIPPRIFTVIAGQTTQCVTKPSATPEFKITTNVTKSLSTCQPWGFTITGGVPPYILTLATLGSSSVTNITIPFGENTAVFINRASPNKQLLGAVSDVTQRWADKTAIISTNGASDNTCRGSGSSTGSPITAPTTSHPRNRHIIIITIPSLLFIGLGIAVFFFLRKRRKQADVKFDEIAARPFRSSRGRGFLNNHLVPVPSKAPPREAIQTTGKTSHMEPRPLSTASLSSASTYTFTEFTSLPNHAQPQASQVLENQPFSLSDHSYVGDTSTYSHPGFVRFPLTSIRTPQDRATLVGGRTGIVNQDRRASSDGAQYIESYHN